MDPQTPISQLPGIGKYYLFKLKRLEIDTLEDLIYHFPFRYDDFSQVRGIGEVSPPRLARWKRGSPSATGEAGDIAPEDKISIVGNVLQIKNTRIRSGKFLTRATIADKSGTLEVIWFNQPYLTKNIKPGDQISLSGKVKQSGRRYQLVAPSYEIVREIGNKQLPDTLHTGRLVPIYPETEGVSSKWLRAKIAGVLPQYLASQKDFLPPQIKNSQQLLDLKLALTTIHFPKDQNDVRFAKKRLGFDELFLIQLAAQQRKRNWSAERHAPALKIDKEKILEFVASLPFKLTDAQKRAAREILIDLKKPIPANRLLEGDVGSGKTIVAAIAAFCVFLNGFDTLVAAPTEILAFQHQKTLANALSPFGIKIGIWTSSRKVTGDITCGTHALLQTFKPKRQVGLVVVDEQHRFGVAQRAKLFLDHAQKTTPHLLTMTATPIPRTLALTLYGDLDLSVLDEMPQGRQKIATHVVPNSKRRDAYQFIEKQIQKRRQSFIVTPFVEPSETMISVRAATAEFTKLQKHFSPKVKLGLLHGRLKSKEKEEIITKFKENKINILVTTPVVEVGIDVQNATVMMIESAERFGLAQLHQLRGRVGRGEHQSYCLLFTDSTSPISLRRLKSMEKINVGFELAEIDLKIRGPGELFGLKQSGFVNLKIADLTDHTAIAQAQTAAQKILEADPTLTSYPLLAQKLFRATPDYTQPN